MKGQRIFPGIILIGFGLYFYLQQSSYSFASTFLLWPTLLLIIGAAFLAQGYWARDYESIFPGVILVGFGIHFHVVNKLTIWPNNIGILILIIALAFLLRYQKTGNGMFQGALFLVISILLLFYETVMAWFGILGEGVMLITNFWPILLVIIGLGLLVWKRK